MSFFGFDTSGHDKAAPGFSQAHDPFAGLSSRGNDIDDALDFEETYDGLGDQLDETDDVYNDDTFGGGSGGNDVAPANARVGKDFDFFGQTAKVASAIDEEHMRYNMQQPSAKAHSGYSQPHSGYADPIAMNPAGMQYYPEQQHMQRPVRTGYEKYRESEQIPDLHVDQSIWGIKPAKPVEQSTYQAPQAASRKIMSLEEVEAAMRAQPPKRAEMAPQELAAAPLQQEHQMAQQHQQHQQPPQQSQPAGQPMTILQRPQSIQSKATPPAPSVQHPVQHHQGHPMQPMQILQNPNRASAEGPGISSHAQQQNLPQGAAGRNPQLMAHPQMAQMTEEEKAAYLDQETKRAKRNHKIWLLSKDNGLMTPQDKNFITRIQLQQLVTATGNPVENGTDAPVVEDFYYQVYSHIRAGQRQNPSQPLSNFAQTYLFQTGNRHGGMRRHGRLAENHFQRMEQQVQRAVEAAKNKPKNPQLVIAGSLGKISFSNAKTPKPLLSIKRPEAETRNSGRRSPAVNGIDRKAVLRNVEKVYSTIMKIEDHVRMIPPPTADADTQKEWGTTLEGLNAQLWNELKVHEPIGAVVPHPFIAFLSCAKGKKAIPRIFPHLSFEQRTTILTMIVFHLDQLDVVQGAAINNGETTLNSRMRENIELFISTVMPSLMQYFNDTGLDIVDGVMHLLATKLNVDLIAKTRIGVSMVTLILSRAVLLKQNGAGTPEQWQKW